ncbi:hypothetical protein GE061_010193 [Apolygus lucorum]|uniref:Uncharacterized protein n=1 Tax=Apolygus lucorum TaxID=248454 RepID=A0A8S9Y2E5_APOLU|nr:hypothetical protein GE061_010193 [Apolygus lucorum]
MMPSRGCHTSKEFWPYSPAIWQMCVLYTVFLSASYLLFGRLAEDNVTGVESLLDPVLLASLPTKPPQDPVQHKNDTDHHDDIPSFSEWANKKMAEVEKNKGENHTVGTTKIRLKTTHPDCGAKVVASNPEAVSAGAVLSPSRDDYMLNPAMSRSGSSLSSASLFNRKDEFLCLDNDPDDESLQTKPPSEEEDESLSKL